MKLFQRLVFKILALMIAVRILRIRAKNSSWRTIRWQKSDGKLGSMAVICLSEMNYRPFGER